MKKPKNKWPVLVLVLIIVLVGGGGLWFWLNPPGTPADSKTQKYQVYQVSSGKMTVSVQATGTVDPGQTFSVYSEIDAAVASVSALAGDAVLAGDTILTYDAQSVRDQITLLESSLATLDSQLANLKSVESSTSVIAQVDGRVKQISVKSGSLVTQAMQDQGSLCVLSTDGQMKVAFTLNKDVVLKIGDKVSCIIGQITTSGIIDSQTADGSLVAVIGKDTYTAGSDVTIKTSDGKTAGIGKLAVNMPVPITAVSGTVSKVYVTENAYIYRGKTLFLLSGTIISRNASTLIAQREQAWQDLQAARAQLNSLELKAAQSGIIAAVKVVNGQNIKSGDTLYTITADSDFQMTIPVDELDIASIKFGQAAAITVDALPGRTFTGKVSRISHIGTSSNGVTTYDVIIKVENPQDLLPAMNASCEVVINQADNAIMVPIGALQSQGNKRYVLVAGTGSTANTTASTTGNNAGGSARSTAAPGIITDISSAKLVEVTVGLVNDTHVQILTGLTAGEKVLIPITSTSTNSGAIMGGFGGLTGNQGTPRTSGSAATGSARQPPAGN